MILKKSTRVKIEVHTQPRNVMKKITALFVTIASLAFLQGCDSDSDSPEPEVTNTIVDVAVADGRFTTLVAALEATGLDATLADTEGTFTVFAPTDDAFALLGQETIDALLADTDGLTDILTYHVLSTIVDSTTAIGAAGSTVETVNGASVGLSLSGDELLVNLSTVIITDIATDNGVIHVIDAVLIPPTERGTPTSNIVDTAVAAGNFTTLLAAAGATGLDAVLADETEEFTVFAPTDAAFAMLGQETIDTLLANPDVLTEILLQHVIAGSVNSVTAYSLNGVSPTSASGAAIPLNINTETDTLTFGGVNVVATDIYTTNGIIHVIDAVIVGDVEVPSIPATVVDLAVEADGFNTLVAALQATGLDSVLASTDTDFTVFAPSDAAFALLGQETIDALLADTETLTNILLYHVISGSAVLQDVAITVAQSAEKNVTMANDAATTLSLSGSTLYVNKSAVSTTNLMAGNGVVHVIDQVILPPAMRGEPTQTIAEVVVATPGFETLLAALDAASLVDTLSDETATFTVFAPTDAAFDKIENSALAGLLNDVDALTNVLLQHVVAGEVTSLAAFAANGSLVDTLSGEDVSVNLVNFTQAANDDNTEVAYDAANQRLVGGNASDKAGFTLYVFDGDLGTAGSACNDGCATNWPPVLVTDGDATSVPGLSTITRTDNTIQATYQGRPLYYFANDAEVGDTNGQGVGGVWWQVDQEQVSLQVQGSNVTTTDIYTTNGVIHVIDTVITETLSGN